MFSIQTQHPVAEWSRDHNTPKGRAIDNSRNYAFNKKLYLLQSHLSMLDNLSVLDIGCAGGGFVKDCVDDGRLAVGVDGTDDYKMNGRPEWDKIPNNLFTADATEPFQILYNEKPFQFSVVTSWEVLEHLEENRLDGLIQNILVHLQEGGIFICSASQEKGFWHVCIHDKEWWIGKFKEHGLIYNDTLVNYFYKDWIRGPHQGLRQSFNMVFSK